MAPAWDPHCTALVTAASKDNDEPKINYSPQTFYGYF